MARCWRVFPWDPGRPEGAPFSASHVPQTTGRGRFDLPVACSPVLYLAETPAHAVAVALQPWRNRPLRPAHLHRAGLPLALVDVRLGEGAAAGIADLCDPATLRRRRIRPDRIASRHRRRTQPVAASIWDSGYIGLRWWSSFWGDWHGVVLFTARAEGSLLFGEPREIGRDSEALREAAAALGMRLAL